MMYSPYKFHKQAYLRAIEGLFLQTTCPASWETYMQVRKQQLELDMEQHTGSK